MIFIKINLYIHIKVSYNTPIKGPLIIPIGIIPFGISKSIGLLLYDTRKGISWQESRDLIPNGYRNPKQVIYMWMNIMVTNNGLLYVKGYSKLMRGFIYKDH